VLATLKELQLETLNVLLQSVCDSDLQSVVANCVLKCPINPITNPNPFIATHARDSSITTFDLSRRLIYNMGTKYFIQFRMH
jgi:hypothetical protein